MLSKVYVFCPAYQTTGGPEALHQLASSLKQLSFNAAIVYSDHNGSLVKCDVPSVYQIYDVTVTDTVEDTETSLVIIPETATYLLDHYRSACRVIWWLSIDNYFTVRGNWFRRIFRRVLRNKKLFEFGKNYSRLIHVAQSYYAIKKLSVLGVKDARLLTDYLRDDFLENADYSLELKENIVVYNPKKGIETTQKIMQQSIGIGLEWVPLINMTPEQVISLLKRAKIYIDFGEHPGRDRIPREAALCGCVVMTGQKGSAGNDVDVPIPRGYKFLDAGQYDQVCLCMKDVAENFAEHHQHFESYRDWVRQNKSRFFQEAKDLMTYEC